MTIKASTKRSLSLLGSILFLIAALFIYSSWIRSEYRVIRELRGAIAAKADFLANQKAIISQVQNLITQYQGAAQIQETISLALPSEERTASIFQQIQAISKNAGLTIQSFGLNILGFRPAPVKISLAKNLGTIQVNLRLLGAYESIKSFLKAAETNVRIMDLRQLRVEPAGKSTENIYNYTITLDTYYQ
jgi:Tfp pilus assembly protein PilO